MQVNLLTITIDNFDRDAMQQNRSGEVSAILRAIADKVEDYGVPNQDGVRMTDSNGNEVGLIQVNWED